MQYSLILPVYNEEENIERLYARLVKIMDQLTNDYELIFVNDGSVDQTPHLLAKLHQKNNSVKIINFSRNFGHQTAVTAGLHYARGQYVAILDADLQDPPEILPRFFDKLKSGYDVVYAVRKNRKEGTIKKFMYDLFYRTLRVITDIDIPLDSGDFCAINQKVVRILNSLPERNRFIRGLRRWIGFKQIGLEYERNPRSAGKSKYTLARLFKLAFDGIFSFSYIPLQMMFFLGLLSLVISIIGIIRAFYLKFFTASFERVPGFATTYILLMFIGGLILFAIGVLGEYTRRIYDEVKRRPHYIIESKIGFTD